MKRALIFAGCLLPFISVHAADLDQNKKSPAAPVLHESGMFGSLSAGLNLLAAPAQSILGIPTPSASVPYLSIGAKFGALGPTRAFGFQVDANLAGASSSWADPNAGNGSAGYVYGGALHVFSGAIPNAKVGAFFAADWFHLSTRRLGEKLPARHFGLEGQYLVLPDLLLRARIGGGILVPEGRVAAFPNIQSYFGGVGLTYAPSTSVRLGADIHYSTLRLARGGASASLDLVDTGVFAEFRLQSAPISIRASASWLHAIGELRNGGAALGAKANGYRVGLSLRYEFGSGDRRGSLVDSEFQTYNLLTGLR